MSVSTRYGLFVPTLNPGDSWVTFLASLERQSLQPHRKLIIDSGSDDQTLELARQAGFETLLIDRSQFDHGGTRQLGVTCLDDCDTILMVTQDIVFADDQAIFNLLKCLDTSGAGCAYGRQLPFESAHLYEKQSRLFNYPAESRTKSLNDRQSLGIKTPFISNSFAAYRRDALDEVKGFPNGIIFAEDMYVGAKLLLAGWQIAYCADAVVYHSHNKGFCELMRRSFDIGVFHATESWLLEEFRSPEGAGLSFVIATIKAYWKENFWLVLMPVMVSLSRFMAYRLGRLHRYWPVCFNRGLSMNRSYWADEKTYGSR